MSECKLTGFQQVLVRDSVEDKWRRQFFDYYDETSGFPYRCIGNGFKCCIPYEGNEHLAGTSNPYVEPYEPKDGDFLTMIGYFNEGKKAAWTCICKEYKDNKIYYYAALDACHELIDEEKNHYDFNPEKYNDEFIRLATEQEKNQLLSKLHEKGKDWDEERKEIVDYVPPYVPKDGDFVKIHYPNKKGLGNDLVGIYEKSDRNGHNLYCGCWTTSETLWPNAIVEGEWNESGKADYIIIQATEEEKNLLLSKLHEFGKAWDAEKKEIVDWKWMPKEGETFYSPSFDPIENAFYVDSFIWKGPNGRCHNLLDMGRVFKTEEKCEPLCNKLNAAIKNVK